MSFILLKLISLFIPLRASVNDESEGLDISQHGEEAYLHAEGGSAAMTATAPPTGQPVLQTVRAEA
jgi:Amt family ammonium transporter